MRPYSPGGALNALAAILQGSIPAISSAHRLQRGLPGYLILFAPTLSHISVNLRPGRRLRLWCSFASLRILLLHAKFPFPLRYSRSTVSGAVSGLSPEISHLTYRSACVRFTPNKSEQRLHPSYYRGCWHEVSRCFLWVYINLRACWTLSRFSTLTELYNPKTFLTHAVLLRQTFVHCAIFPTAASRRSLDRVSVPVWLIILSNQLDIIALVGHYPTNKLMSRRPILS